jgi:uncharacterized protein (DUF1330 family)
MGKGYWIARVDVDDVDGYQEYVRAAQPAYEKYGAVPLARGGRSHHLEGEGRARNVIWEFPTFEAAIECYESAEYQSARALRAPLSRGDFVVVEGL